MTFIIGYLVTYLTPKLGRFAKPVVYAALAVAVIGIILVAGASLRNCYENRKIEATAEAVKELKRRETVIETQATITGETADVEEKKAEAAVRAVEEIEKEAGVSFEEARKNLCLAYPENSLCR